MSENIDLGRVPKRTLYTGEEIPAIGLGTFGSDKYTAEQISAAVYGAVKSGYRLIDCASVYQNEDQIGAVLNKLFEEKTVTREELFITSKVWNDSHRKVVASCKKSLKELKLNQIDLYFVHWPFPNYHAPGCDGDARNPDSRPFSVEEFMDTWRQCEQLVDMGLVRYIGMSNIGSSAAAVQSPSGSSGTGVPSGFSAGDTVSICKSAWNGSHWLLPIGFPFQTGTRPDSGRYSRHSAS